tara:strand:- start:140 stop:325 length:186 start_codon:yes stop_codon:yes gene_type:complete
MRIDEPIGEIDAIATKNPILFENQIEGPDRPKVQAHVSVCHSSDDGQEINVIFSNTKTRYL